VRRSILLGILVLLGLVLLGVTLGCPATTNTGVLPITALEIDISDILSGADLGCGKGPNDVYKYAAIVQQDPNGNKMRVGDCELEPLAGGTFDCFNKAVFGNLPLPYDGGALPDGGSATYSVQIYFFNYETWQRVGPAKINQAVSPLNGFGTPICGLDYNWATTCIGTETDMIAVNAACIPVTLGPAGLDAGHHDAGKKHDGGADARRQPDALPDAPQDATLGGDTADE
jgi:hypothetical protein